MLRITDTPRRRYLPSDITAANMRRDYNDKHTQQNVRYRQQIRSLNISFAVLGHEECETCPRHGHHSTVTHGLPAGSVSQHADGCEACAHHQQHISHAKEAREAYRADREKELSKEELVVSADLMKISLIPVLPHKAAVFTPRLIVFNETFAPLAAKSGTRTGKPPVAILWHEAIAGRDAVSVAATYWRFLALHREKRVIIYVDNCSAQNK